ncbi:hypothetical protein AgCh_038734 [Apium graveolens]
MGEITDDLVDVVSSDDQHSEADRSIQGYDTKRRKVSIYNKRGPRDLESFSVVDQLKVVSTPITGGSSSSLPGLLEFQLNEFMLEMRTNYNQLIKKMDEVAEENKFWKDLVLGLHTSATTTKSGLFPTSSTPGSVNLQDLCIAAGKKLVKDYGLKGLFAKTAATRDLEGTFKASDDVDDVLKDVNAENKGDTHVDY